VARRVPFPFEAVSAATLSGSPLRTARPLCLHLGGRCTPSQREASPDQSIVDEAYKFRRRWVHKISWPSRPRNLHGEIGRAAEGLAPIGASAPASTGPGSRIMACRVAAAIREGYSASPDEQHEPGVPSAFAEPTGGLGLYDLGCGTMRM
jgi:hypothetical protein